MTLGSSRSVLAGAIALTLALGMSACGGSDDGGGGDSPKEQVEAAFAKYSEEARDGDAAAACAALTPEIQKAVARDKTCEAQMKAIANLLSDDFPLPTLVDVKVDGDTVTGKLHGNGKTNPDPFTFTKVDGVWKVSGAPFTDDFDGKRGYKFQNGPGLE